MSWQEYIDNNLMCQLNDKGHTLTSAAIVGQDGGVWAQSTDFPAIVPDQVDRIMYGFAETQKPDDPFSSFLIGDVKYYVTQGEPQQVIRGKCQGGGVTVKRTNTALVVGIWKDPVTHGECNKVVETLGEYLVDTGY